MPIAYVADCIVTCNLAGMLVARLLWTEHRTITFLLSSSMSTATTPHTGSGVLEVDARPNSVSIRGDCNVEFG